MYIQGLNGFYLSVLINMPLHVDSVPFFFFSTLEALRERGKLGLICLLPTYQEQLPDLDDLKSNPLPFIIFIKKNCTLPGLSQWMWTLKGNLNFFYELNI